MPAVGAVNRMHFLYIGDFEQLVDVDFVLQLVYYLELLMVYRLHLAIVDTTVAAHCIVVLTAAALLAAASHIEHYYSRSNYQMVERSKIGRKENSTKKNQIYKLYLVHISMAHTKKINFKLYKIVLIFRFS